MGASVPTKKKAGREDRPFVLFGHGARAFSKISEKGGLAGSFWRATRSPGRIAGKEHESRKFAGDLVDSITLDVKPYAALAVLVTRKERAHRQAITPGLNHKKEVLEAC